MTGEEKDNVQFMDMLAWHAGKSHQRMRAALELCSGGPWSCREEKSSPCSDLQVVQLVIRFVHKEKWPEIGMHVNSGGMAYGLAGRSGT